MKHTFIMKINEQPVVLSMHGRTKQTAFYKTMIKLGARPSDSVQVIEHKTDCKLRDYQMQSIEEYRNENNEVQSAR